MDNYLIIDDVDICFIQQNSWIILLEKQVGRNYYLLKQYEFNNQGKKYKINCKELNCKIKDSIIKRISQKIQLRKNLEKVLNQSDNNSVIFSLRRKTQDEPKRATQNKLHRNNSNLSVNSKFKTSQQIYEFRQSRFVGTQQKSQQNILPLQPSSLMINENFNLLKKVSQKSFQKQHKTSKRLLHAKTILSLHDLQFSKKQATLGEELTFHKRLTHIQRLLVGSSMNSPKKFLNSSKENLNIMEQKKISFEFPQITKSSCKKICLSQFMNQISRFEGEFKQKTISNKKIQQQTKQSDSDNINELQSIIQFCIIKSQQNKKKQQYFQDNHISITKNNYIKNYRISKVKNLKFPVY